MYMKKHSVSSAWPCPGIIGIAFVPALLFGQLSSGLNREVEAERQADASLTNEAAITLRETNFFAVGISTRATTDYRPRLIDEGATEANASVRNTGAIKPEDPATAR